MTPAPDPGLDTDLRRHVAYQLEERQDVIVADSVATFPLSSESRRLDANYCVRLGNLVTRLLIAAILDGRLDARGPGISELAALLTGDYPSGRYKARDLTPVS